MFKKVISVGAAVLLLSGQISAVHTNGWVKLHKAHESSIVKIILPVEQSNLELVEKLFWEISNPKSSMYGRHLSFDTVGSLVKNQAAYVNVMKYLKNLGVHSLKSNPHGTFVTAYLPVSMANRAFGTDFHVYSHPESSEYILKTEQVSLPDELKGFITHVPHVSYFPRVSHRVEFRPNSFTAGEVTPELLFRYYGVEGNAQNGATQSVFEPYGDWFSNAALNLFQAEHNLTVRNVSNIIGPNDEEFCRHAFCSTGNLDTQYITSIAQGAETTFWIPSEFSFEPFMHWAIAMASNPNPPQVNAISNAGETEITMSPFEIKAFNTEAMKLGLQGVSVIVFSGAYGAASVEAALNISECSYAPHFPASSPYVTSVGATRGPESGWREIACSRPPYVDVTASITSGGGFSVTFEQPAYQKSQVAAYFNNVGSTPFPGYYADGRGYPDVSVMGFNYNVTGFNNDSVQFGLFDGGNAAVFAGMITLINDARLAQGKSALGFLNQALYSLNPDVWNDIIIGNNFCVRVDACCKEGFCAFKGWDPVTGLGSPRFPALKQALLAL